ncbi:MAG: SLBB domain-containing protein [Prevotella sp.]|nr:SLBB domain-containing protein [Prevotella sp.]
MHKHLLLAILICFSVVLESYAQMSDSQVIAFISREQKLGTSQSQIVTKLMQRGVKIDQIRRIRQRYSNQISRAGLSGAADVAVTEASTRMRQNLTDKGKESQDIVSGKAGTGNEAYQEADADYAEAQQKVNAGGRDAEESANAKRVFGHDIFNQRLLSFEPNMNIATPENYVIGVGDVLVVDIYGASQRTMQLQVSPEGTVTVPGYGPLKVLGLKVSAAQSKVRQTLGARYSTSSIRLTVGQTRSMMVNVMGEVRTPGNYTLSAFATVFHALYKAGGINDLGTLRNIKVYRNGRLVTIVDVYEYILNGRLAGNIRLEENDVIVVGPYDCLVGISGNVKRPMFYEMRPTETAATLVDFAGGFTGDAYKKAIRLLRKSGDRFSVFNIGEFEMADFKVSDGDAFSVDGILNRFENMVEVKGAVFRPGQFQLGNNISTVRSLIEAADGVTEDAFTSHAVLHRLLPDRSLEVVQVDLKGILDGTVADIPLKNEDVLFVPTHSDRINERTYTILGEVFSPGTYQYAANTTIEDLIVQAGGLTDAASTVKVDVSRRIIDPKSKESSNNISQNFTFELKDGFVIDGQPGFMLQPYDVVHVRRSPTFMEPRNVTVQGEVLFTGVYTLSTKNQRLSDAIKAAGGLTADAYVKGARLVRYLSDDELDRRKDMLKQVLAGQSQKDTVNIKKLDLGRTYTVGIQLDKALENPGSDYDIQLRDSDRIVVPEFNGTVKISGEVMYPNTVAFSNRKSYRWYINQAGGFGTRAKKSKAYIVYQNGTMAMAKSGKIEPGCEIIVPTKPKKDTAAVTQWLSIGSSITGIAAMIATIANMVK